MKKCPYCGHDNEDKAVCCARCYAGIPQEKLETEKKEPVKARSSKKNNKE